MLIFIKEKTFTYIGKTLSIWGRIQQHNLGVTTIFTEILHPRLYALRAYICGFNSNNNLILYIGRKYKIKRDRLISNGISDTKTWETRSFEVITCLNTEHFNI